MVGFSRLKPSTACSPRVKNMPLTFIYRENPKAIFPIVDLSLQPLCRLCCQHFFSSHRKEFIWNIIVKKVAAFFVFAKTKPVWQTYCLSEGAISVCYVICLEDFAYFTCICTSLCPAQLAPQCSRVRLSHTDVSLYNLQTLMNALLNGHATTRASIIQAPLSVLVTKDMLFMASHIVEVSCKKTLQAMLVECGCRRSN